MDSFVPEGYYRGLFYDIIISQKNAPPKKSSPKPTANAVGDRNIYIIWSVYVIMEPNEIEESLRGLADELSMKYPNTTFIAIDAEWILDEDKCSDIVITQYGKSRKIADKYKEFFLGAFLYDKETKEFIYFRFPNNSEGINDFIQLLQKFYTDDIDDPQNVVLVSYFSKAEFLFIKNVLLELAPTVRDYDDIDILDSNSSIYLNYKNKIFLVDLMRLTAINEGLDELARTLVGYTSKDIGKGGEVHSMDSVEVYQYNKFDCIVTFHVFCAFHQLISNLYQKFGQHFTFFRSHITQDDILIQKPFLTLGSIAENLIHKCITNSSLPQDQMLQTWWKISREEDIVKSSFNPTRQMITLRNVKKARTIYKDIRKYFKIYGSDRIDLYISSFRSLNNTFFHNYTGGGFIDSIATQPIIDKFFYIDFTSLYPISLLLALQRLSFKFDIIYPPHNQHINFLKTLYKNNKNKNKGIFVVVKNISFKKGSKFILFNKFFYTKMDKSLDYKIIPSLNMVTTRLETLDTLITYIDNNCVKNIDVEQVIIFDMSKPEYSLATTTFFNIIRDVLELRINLPTDDINRVGYKMLLNILYGKIVQHKVGHSKLFLPIIGSSITALSREIMIKSIYHLLNKGVDVIATATDSIIAVSKGYDENTSLKNDLDTFILNEYGLNNLIKNFVPFKLEYNDEFGCYLRVKAYFILNLSHKLFNNNAPKNSADVKVLINKFLALPHKDQETPLFKTYKKLGMNLNRDIIARNFSTLVLLYYAYKLQEESITFNKNETLNDFFSQYFESNYIFTYFTKEQYINYKDFAHKIKLAARRFVRNINNDNNHIKSIFDQDIYAIAQDADLIEFVSNDEEDDDEEENINSAFTKIQGKLEKYIFTKEYAFLLPEIKMKLLKRQDGDKYFPMINDYIIHDTRYSQLRTKVSKNILPDLTADLISLEKTNLNNNLESFDDLIKEITTTIVINRSQHVSLNFNIFYFPFRLYIECTQDWGMHNSDMTYINIKNEMEWFHRYKEGKCNFYEIPAYPQEFETNYEREINKKRLDIELEKLKLMEKSMENAEVSEEVSEEKKD